MFTQKSSTEIITLENEILVVGISLQKSRLPISFDSLGKLWERYAARYRGTKLENCAMPETEYAVCLNTVPDYITGCGVTAVGTLAEDCVSQVIPAGKYIKDCFNAESFDKLVFEECTKRDVKAWAEENNVKINGEFSVEVYPNEEFAKGNFEMYTLTPIFE